ncbi:class I SAM-dependent methyltransferase [Nonlabens antarcticus]|uniref:class I SAM-dependent methyltransferase n=1 Tax=Nonlabens antarcticus TaxID=392714 RepID=UPI001891545E|nr:methyltransferase domain-containing protein [Nonlabens antarcticus]
MILKRVIHKLGKLFNILPANQRAEKRRIAKLRINKSSDIERWVKNEELQTEWNSRTILLADYVAKGANVIEFGAANGALKLILDNKATYQGVDIVARDIEFLVCDLNWQPINIELSEYDTVILSGVFEYVYDISYVLNYFFDQNIKHVFFSYACSDISREDRLLNGWLSDFKQVEVVSIITDSGFEIEETIDWKDQKLFICHRVK